MPGVHDRLVTRSVEQALAELADQGWTGVVDPLEQAEQPVRLARHTAAWLRRVLALVQSPADRLTVVADVLARLAELDAEAEDDRPNHPVRVLRAVNPTREGPGRRSSTPPVLGLDQPDLLVNARGEPSMLHNLLSEIASADRIDVVVAFIRFSGLRPLLEAFRAAAERGVQIRVLTTTYLGGTDIRAIGELARLGAEIKISYDLGQTRLHAKGWLFERDTGYHTAYIGSSNLSHTAMTQGQEWNLRLTSAQTPELVEKFRSAFGSYWDDPALGFETYDPAGDSAAEAHLAAALDAAGGRHKDREDLSPFTITPLPHQRIMLEDLERERQVYGRHRNLIVAATGTGKTALAAFDYRRLCDASPSPDRPRLLFVAHRKEILTQSRRAFREVLRSGDFGELLVDGDRPREWNHVFASIQSLRTHLDVITPDAYDMVIVDEFHHAASQSYRSLLDMIRPRVLLGLTATPERLDGQDVTSWFDGHVATELRLWDALEQNLLSPFHYYGVGHGELDFRRVTWTAGRYLPGELDNLVTGNDVIMGWVLERVRDTVCDPRRMRALAFACTVAHAHFVADRFNAVGIGAVALSAETPTERRRRAVEDLRAGRIQVIVTVDLFNEGVDVPEVDTVLLMRPTESTTVFLQQLGRGLRRSEGKDVLTVLDFIGFQDKRFRFDLRFRALTGLPRQQLTRAVAEGFPYLPAGSFITLDRVAQEAVLANVRANIPGDTRALIDDVRRHAETAGRRRYRLGDYLDEAGTELPDVYRRDRLSWTEVCRRAGLDTPSTPAGSDHTENALLGRIRSLTHVDDLPRLDAYTRLVSGGPGLSPADERFATMLYFTLWPDGTAPNAVEGLRAMRALPAVVDELGQVLELARQRIPRVSHALDSQRFGACPLRVHARYGREEMLAGLGWARCGPAGRRPKGHAAGTREVADLRADAFDITWQKTEKAYSPTTMYADHAVSAQEIHWESPNALADDAATTRRYIEHEARGRSILLFAREVKRGPLGAQPMMFLGPASYVSHEGSRPVAFRWRLHRPMPTEHFESARVMTA